MSVEYARSDFGGEIEIVLDKYVRGAFGEICVQLGDFHTREFAGENWETNLKISKNIVDLIEVGDYVNGSKVIDIAKGNIKALYLEQVNSGALTPTIEKDIKTILTKEQYNANCYRLEEK